MAAATDSRTLKVPGATLYYEVRGSGPVLVLIPGGPTDAGMFAGMARLLADRYTVVSYDPRGHSRSTAENAAEDVSVESHADDAAALIDAMGTEPAYVMGSSGGGTIGLALVARHPDKVRAFLAHEPPVMELLPDKERWRSTFQEISDAYETGGAFAAMGRFGEAVEDGGPKYSEQQQPQGEPDSEQGEPDPEQGEMMQRMMGNFDFFIAHEIRPIGAYVPDFDALEKARTRIVVGAGKTSGEQGACRAAKALAERLGIEVSYFEGAHGGFGASDEVFAARVDELLR
jgi:pimeloyl-ACP methyl ester carboxylesterase